MGSLPQSTNFIQVVGRAGWGVKFHPGCGAGALSIPRLRGSHACRRPLRIRPGDRQAHLPRPQPLPDPRPEAPPVVLPTDPQTHATPHYSRFPSSIISS